MDYVAPETVAEACKALEADDAHCLAGGQSLVAMMNLGMVVPGRLVSLRRIPELRGIATQADGSLRIGAMTTHAELAAMETVRPGPALLAQAARQVAYPAIRVRGTIGGSVALADPAADYPVVLLAVDATIEIASASGSRRVTADAFFRGMFETALVRGEIVTAVHVPSGPPDSGAAYEKLSLVVGDFAIVSVAAMAGRTATVAVGGCAMKPLLLTGLDVADNALLAAGRKLAADSDPPSDHRASTAYRRRVVPELIRRAVRAAIIRMPA